MTGAGTKGRVRLLNPGPVTLTARVRAALNHEDVCHREPEFAALALQVKKKLASVYEEAASDYEAILMTGSGTCAVEAMVSSLTPRVNQAKKKVLVVANGVYGERMAAMLTAQGKAFDLVKSEWVHGVDVAATERHLAAGGYSHVLTVHHETTTGRLNDVAAIGALCKKFDVPLLLDAVSSFAGEEIRFAEWNLEACAATANKCLHGAPGIAFVLAKKSVFAGARTSGASSLYLDLFKYEKEQRTGFSPFTQATHVMYALDEALDELRDAGGFRARREHYRALSTQVIEACEKLDIPLLLGERSVYSSLLTSYRLPKGLAYERLHDSLKAHGFVVYAGQGNYNGSIFRIAVMGDLTRADIDELGRAIGAVRAAVVS